MGARESKPPAVKGKRAPAQSAGAADMTGPRFDFMKDENDQRLVARRCIAAATTTSADSGILDISRCGLASWPFDIDSASTRELALSSGAGTQHEENFETAAAPGMAPVTELRLAFNRFQAIPDAIALLPGLEGGSLERIDLTCNHLFGNPKAQPLKFPSGPYFANVTTLLLSRNALLCADANSLLDRLPLLRVADFSFNPLQKFPSSLERCPHIASLDLTQVAIEVVAWDIIEKLIDLEVLRLDSNLIRNVDQCVFSLPKLVALSLESNPIEQLLEVEEGKTCPLTALNISRLHISALSAGFLASCKNTLTTLDLQNSNLGEFPIAVCDARSLVRLRVSGASFISVPEELAQLDELEQLVLRFNKLICVPKAVASLPQLRLLDLTGNLLESLTVGGGLAQDNVDEEKAGSLLHLTRLESLSVAYNDIASVQELRAHELLELSEFHALRYFSVDGNRLVGDENPLLKLARPQQGKEEKSVTAAAFDSRSNHPNLATRIVDDAGLARALRHQMERGDLQTFFRSLIATESKIETIGTKAVHEQNSSVGAEDLRDAIFGCIVGCALGDAIGLSTEFLARYQAYIYYHAPRPLWMPWSTVGSGADADVEQNSDPVRAAQRAIESDSEWLLDRHRCRWIRGDMTDDTDQLLLILDGIVTDCNGAGVDPGKFSQRLFRWAHNGFSELGDHGGMGIGSTVGAVLRHPDFLPPAKSEPSGDYHPHKAARLVWEQQNKNAAANGAVMRAAICGIPNFWDEQLIEQQTRDIAAVTHVDPRSTASCLIVTHLVGAMLRQSCADEPRKTVDANIDIAVSYALRACKNGPNPSDVELGEHITELKWHVDPERTLRELDLGSQKAMGYSLKALGAALWSVRQPNGNFADAIQKLLMEAGDADTNGAVAGALLGTRVGFRALPSYWINALPHREMLLERCESLYAAVSAQYHQMQSSSKD